MRSSRDGCEIVLSLLADVGLVLGESVLLRRSDYACRLDLDAANAEMTSRRRPVVMRAAEGVMPYRVQNVLGAEVLDAVCGAPERAWRGVQGGGGFP